MIAGRFVEPSDPGAVELGMLRQCICKTSGDAACTCGFGTSPLLMNTILPSKKPKWWRGQAYHGRVVGRGVEVTDSTLPGAGLGAFVAETSVANGEYVTGYDGWEVSREETRRYKPSQCTHASPA